MTTQQLTEEFFAVLTPTKHSYTIVNGVRPVTEFKVDRVRQSKPLTGKNEVAVRLRITLPASLFETVIPTVDIEIQEGDVFTNAKVEAESVDDDA